MTLPATLAARARDFAEQALSQNSRRAYRADWQHYSAWCHALALEPLPAGPEQVASYLTSMAETHKRATTERRLVTIGQAHKLRGLPWIPAHPIVRAALRGMFRRYGRPKKKAAALGVSETIQIAAVCEKTLSGLRDRAMFLISFAGAFRRSETAGIRFEDLTFRDGAVDVFLPSSKGDQENEGTIVTVLAGQNVSTCPVAALQRWLRAAPTDGYVFRAVRADGTVIEQGLHRDSIGRILQKRAAEAGITAGPRERISSHGFRAGFITEAYKRGARDEVIMSHSRHRDLKTMRGYVRRAKLVDEHPGRGLGL
jgi:integrase